MSATNTIIRRYWLSLLIVGGLVFAGVYFSRGLGRIDHPLHVSPGSLVFGLMLQMVYWLLLSALWKRIVADVSGSRIALKESFYQLCLVSIAKYLPGKLWGAVARGSRMKRLHGISEQQIITATCVEQYFVLYSAVLVTAVLLAGWHRSEWAWGLLAAVVVGTIVGQRYHGLVMALILRLYVRFGGKDRQVVAVGNLSGPKYYFLLCAYAALWVLLGFVFASVYFTFFPAHVSSRLLYSMLLANTVSVTAGFLALFAPGGIGVREAVSSGILASQIPLVDAVLLSLLFRLWLIVTEIVLGVIAFWGSGKDVVAALRRARTATDE